jgi:uncharacterized membrane protein YdbT with pleckstrin-like domain
VQRAFGHTRKDLGRAEPAGMELNARPHGVALVRPLSKAALAAIAGTACVFLGGDVHWVVSALGVTALGLSALLAAATVLEWDRTDVLLTRDLLRVRWGVVRRHTAEMPLRRDEPVEIQQSVLGRVLGYGTVVAGGIEVPFVPVREPPSRG